MAVERSAQVAHDALADAVVEIALAYADEARNDRDHDHQPHEQVEQSKVQVLYGDVDQELEQNRVDDAQEAGEQDGAQHDQDLGPVGCEEGDDLARRSSLRFVRRAGRSIASGGGGIAVATAAGERHE